MNEKNGLTKHKNVLICGEVSHKKISTVTAEILQTGRELSDMIGESVNVLLIGIDIEEAAEDAIACGADKAYLASGAPFEESEPEHYVRVIAKACSQLEPRIVLFGQTDMGRDIAPRVAGRLNVPVTMDCVRLDFDSDLRSIRLTKPVYGGNAYAVWKAVDQSTQIATMRPRVTEPAKSDGSRQGEILSLHEFEEEMLAKSRLLCSKKEESKGIRLEEAKVVVAGGGGIGGKEGFQLIEDLAQTLRGAIGTSRVPCDEGWMPKSLEIGQTGHMVSPDVYVSIGISGAPQHLAGCSGSKLIVAINKDPEAHIFKESDLGLVGDYKEALPSLIAKLKSSLDD
jgi:electron transfer flavoprotein alpha subunit